MPHTFQIGDAVRISAAFLRSIDPSAAKGWPTRYDHGTGWIVDITPCGAFDLLKIWFYDLNDFRTYNHNNIIHQKDNWNEAMRAEHRPRNQTFP